MEVQILRTKLIKRSVALSTITLIKLAVVIDKIALITSTFSIGCTFIEVVLFFFDNNHQDSLIQIKSQYIVETGRERIPPFTKFRPRNNRLF